MTRYTGPPDERPDERDAELLRYERDRRRRARRRDEVSWMILAWFLAGACALLAYDSGGAALDAHRTGRAWLYPALVSVSCLAGLVSVVWWALRRRRAGVSDDETRRVHRPR